MKRIILTLSFCLAATIPVLADDTAATDAGSTDNTATNVFHSDLERASYALGMFYGHGLHQRGADVDFSAFARGFQDAQSGGTLLMTPQEMQQTLMEYQKAVAEEQQHKRELLALENKKKSEAFLAANRKKSGVKVLSDGMQYKVIADGKGPRPGSNDVVLVNYRGTFVDGTVFDSTTGSPVEESLSETKIKGLREALPMMKPGAVWEIVIPSDLAYGTNGLGTQIPPNAALVYTLQLVTNGPAGTSPMAALTNHNPPLTSEVIAVPSAADLKKGKQPYKLKPEEIQNLQLQLQKTNR